MGSLDHVLELGGENGRLSGGLNVVESATFVRSVGSRSTTTTPVHQSGAPSAPPSPIFHISLIVPRSILVSRFQPVNV